jgi:hypothetical protein
MKIKKTTVFLLLAAVLLGGVTLLTVQTQQPSSEQAGESEPQDLFDFEESQVQAFTLTTEAESYEFERTEAGEWQMLQPEQAPASQASIAFLLDQMAAAESTRSITIANNERSDFGLDTPLATVAITLDNQETHQLVLGGYDFNRSFIYALVDPPTDDAADLPVFLVSPNFENAVTRPREEWKRSADEAPPASPAPEDNPQASPEASPAPAAPSPAASEAPSEPSPPETSPAPAE